jgi:polysaccharide export outer membrane protein
MVKKIGLFLFATLLLTSCVSKEKIVYFQNVNTIEGDTTKFETKLKPDDLLMIIVSAPDVEAAVPFNLPTGNVMGAAGNSLDLATSQQRYQSYLIDSEGNIQFPVIGALKLAGLTRSEAMTIILEKLRKYINNPIVNLRIMNYKVSVIGEVVRPGSFDLQTERITLPEAISKAGDMTIYGNRQHVLVVRETDGKKTYNYIDMTKADFFNSPFYYLTQNDMVVVEPNKTKINSSMVGPNVTVGLTALSLIITIIALATK